MKPVRSLPQVIEMLPFEHDSKQEKSSLQCVVVSGDHKGRPKV